MGSKVQIYETLIIQNQACFSYQMEAMILAHSIFPLKQPIKKKINKYSNQTLPYPQLLNNVIKTFCIMEKNCHLISTSYTTNFTN